MPDIIFYFSMDFPFSPQGKNVYVLRGRSYGSCSIANTNKWALFFWAPKSLQMMTAAMKLKKKKKKCLLLGRKAMPNLDSILKCRDINLPTKIHLVKAMVFPVVMYGCES